MATGPIEVEIRANLRGFFAAFARIGEALAQGGAQLAANALRASEAAKRLAILIDGGEAYCATGADGVTRVRRR